MLKVYNYITHTKTLGPYTRFALWTQGCPFRCSGCMTEDSQSMDGGIDIAIEDISKLILDTKDIEGITISGGEPFIQDKEISKLIKSIKSKKDLGIIIYTGFSLEQLKQKKDKNINEILQNTDILIDGLYEATLNDNISLRGSSNQNIHVLSNRYNDIFYKYYNQQKRETEVHMLDKFAMISGIPKKKENKSEKSTNTIQSILSS